MTDEQAMWRVQSADDSEAFAVLVTRWRRPLERLCERMIGDPHRAEDLTQEAFSRFFAHRKKYQRSARVSTFIWRIALNLCYDELRRRQRRGELLSHSESDEISGENSALASMELAPDDQLVESERAHSVRNALLKLAEPYRAVLVLKHYENLKFREIAEVLCIPEGTVKSRMAEAMARLSRLLSSVIDDAAPTRFPHCPRSTAASGPMRLAQDVRIAPGEL